MSTCKDTTKPKNGIVPPQVDNSSLLKKVKPGIIYTTKDKDLILIPYSSAFSTQAIIIDLLGRTPPININKNLPFKPYYASDLAWYTLEEVVISFKEYENGSNDTINNAQSSEELTNQPF